jgi:hypothetical protein
MKHACGAILMVSPMGCHTFLDGIAAASTFSYRPQNNRSDIQYQVCIGAGRQFALP